MARHGALVTVLLGMGLSLRVRVPGSWCCARLGSHGSPGGLAEIAQVLGLTRQRVDQLARLPGFPEPDAVLTAGRIWKRDDVEAWARETGRLK